MVGNLSKTSAVPNQQPTSKLTNENRVQNPQIKKAPEILVFDSFGRSKVFDYNNDGIKDRDHGDVIADIIESQTDLKVTQINVDDFGRAEDIANYLNKLLAQNIDFSNVFINLSIEWDSSIDDLLLKVADKGAKIYIAAGNESINSSAKQKLAQHPNIFIVAASDGIVGKAPMTQASKRNITNPWTERVSNGVIAPEIKPQGIDINHDEKIDMPLSVLAPNTYTNLSGQKLKDVYSSDVRRRAELKLENNEYLGSESLVSLLEESDKSEESKVLSLTDLQELGILDPSMARELVANNNQDLNKVFVLLKPFADWNFSLGDVGNVILYTEVNGVLKRFTPVLDSSIPATSWATPNALVEDVKKTYN